MRLWKLLRKRKHKPDETDVMLALAYAKSSDRNLLRGISSIPKLPETGSMTAGPSEDYKALLRGEITPEEYVRRLKASVRLRDCD